MRTLEQTVPAAYDGRKLLHFLRGGMNCSSTLVRSLKAQPDGILCNGAPARTIDRICAGDRVTITLCEQVKSFLPCDREVAVLYEDDDLIVYNKPAAMACHPAKSLQEGTLLNVFAAHCEAAGVEVCGRILNRMDKDTSGALVIAKNGFAAAALTGKMDKCYLAVVSGRVDPAAGTIDAPIGQPDRTDPRRAVMAEGKPARTGYETVATGEDWSVLRCTLHTGRTHQIRVHLSSQGHPLLGDTLYGGDGAALSRQALHCAGVRFVHPVSGERMILWAPPPQELTAFLGGVTVDFPEIV